MSRVLLAGESWFVYSVHQKGFDAFYTSDYTEGGSEFVASLEAAGHTVTRIPAHRIAEDFPSTAEELAAVADVVVISDVGANTFLISKDTFVHSVAVPNKIAAIRDFVEQGGGLLMVGGYMTFSGIDAKARWGRTDLAAVLPVTILDRDDRVELPAGSHPEMLGTHEITAGLDEKWPQLLGLNEVVAKSAATVLATAAGHPLLVVGFAGRGRSAAFTSDLAPHWATPAFLEWSGYDVIFDRLVRWLDGEAA